MKRLFCTTLFLMFLCALSLSWNTSPGYGQQYPLYGFDNVAHHQNVREVSYIETEPSLKMDVQVVDGKWYLYLAHYWGKHGWTVVDVTDPKTPKIVKRIYVDDPYAESTDTTQIAVEYCSICERFCCGFPLEAYGDS